MTRVPTGPSLSRVYDALSWALDLIDLYDKHLIDLGSDPQQLDTRVHQQGKHMARESLRSLADIEEQARNLIDASSRGQSLTRAAIPLLQSAQRHARVRGDAEAYEAINDWLLRADVALREKGGA